jgi:hypothetical protein
MVEPAIIFAVMFQGVLDIDAGEDRLAMHHPAVDNIFNNAHKWDGQEEADHSSSRGSGPNFVRITSIRRRYRW